MQSKRCSGEAWWFRHLVQVTKVFLPSLKVRHLMWPLASLDRTVWVRLSHGRSRDKPGFDPLYQLWVGGVFHSSEIFDFSREYNSKKVSVEVGVVEILQPSLARISAISFPWRFTWEGTHCKWTSWLSEMSFNLSNIEVLILSPTRSQLLRWWRELRLSVKIHKSP